MTALPHAKCRAEVVAGGITTTYVVAGQGPIGVLLAQSEGPDVGPLLGRLRIFSPVVPGQIAPERLGEWFDGFLDGLGLGRVVLLADAHFGAFAGAYAATTPDRVSAVVLLPVSGPIDFEKSPDSLGA